MNWCQEKLKWQAVSKHEHRYIILVYNIFWQIKRHFIFALTFRSTLLYLHVDWNKVSFCLTSWTLQSLKVTNWLTKFYLILSSHKKWFLNFGQKAVGERLRGFNKIQIKTTEFYVSSNLEPSENYRLPDSNIKTLPVATLLKEESLKDSMNS